MTSRRKFLATGAGLAAGGVLTSALGPASLTGTAARRPVGTDPVSMALHVHASFSEGRASMHAQLDQAHRQGVDVLWWTEHDFRTSALGYIEQVGFDGPSEGANETAWTWRTEQVGGGGTGEYVDSPRSPEEPYGRALRLRTGGGGLVLTGEAWNYHYSTCLADTELTLDVLPVALGDDAYLVVELLSSYHPATAGRPAGTYRIRYLLGPGDPGRRIDAADPLCGIVTIPRPEATLGGGWYRLTLRPVDDLGVCWPDLVAGDHGLATLRVGLLATAGHAGEVVVDRLRFHRTRRTDGGLALQRELMAAYTDRYPGVRQYQATEVSLVRHLNWFGGDLRLPDYGGRRPVKVDDEPSARALVEAIHAAGGLASYNHPLQGALNTARRLAASLVAGTAMGCDLLEVACGNQATEDLLSVADVCARNAVFVTATGASDDHSGRDWLANGAPWVTVVRGDPVDQAALVSALGAGQAWVTRLGEWRGVLGLTAPDGTGMGGVSLAGGLAKVPVAVTATDLPDGGSVDLVEGVVDLAGAGYPDPQVEVRNVPAARFTSGNYVHELAGPGRYLRTVVRSAAGEIVGFSNPVWVLDPDGGVVVPRNRTTRSVL